MSIRSRLTELGIPCMEGQAALYYNIGTAAITLAVLALLGWLHVAFGRQFYISFSWILVVVMVVMYFLRKINILLGVATLVALALLTLIGALIGSPFSSIFGLIIFLILAIGGWYLQHQAYKMQQLEESTTQELLVLFVAPLGFTAYLLERLKFIDTNAE